MRSQHSLRNWIDQLLYDTSPVCRHAAWELLRALLIGFTVNLSQLARQLDHQGSARIDRQRLSRWLSRPHWKPPQIYARLLRLGHRVFSGREVVPLLVDMTDLADGWQVLQVSICFQRRALPLYRAVRPYADAPITQAQMVEQALAFLARHLPGPRRRYVVVADRGFAGFELVRYLQAQRWRYVLRVKSTWKLKHRDFTGSLRVAAQQGRVSEAPTWLGDAILGDERRHENKRVRNCTAHLVWWHGSGHAEPWFLVTSENSAPSAIAIYQRRMRIECDFKDMKGPLGLDELAKWLDLGRVERFLAVLCVYEWRLAFLWLMRGLREQAERWRVHGRLSWIWVAREWIQHLMRTGTFQAHACL